MTVHLVRSKRSPDERSDIRVAFTSNGPAYTSNGPAYRIRSCGLLADKASRANDAIQAAGRKCPGGCLVSRRISRRSVEGSAYPTCRAISLDRQARGLKQKSRGLKPDPLHELNR